MKKKMIIVLIITTLITLTGCQSMKRIGKNISSDYGGGLDRVLTVYDQNGKEIKKYEGKFDIQGNDYGNKVLFDLNGKRTVIYNAVVVVEEK